MTYYRHLRNYSGLLVATFAYFIDEETKTVYYGVAVCSKKDKFSRKIGRSISTRRLMDGYKNKPKYVEFNRYNGNSFDKNSLIPVIRVCFGMCGQYNEDNFFSKLKIITMNVKAHNYMYSIVG